MVSTWIIWIRRFFIWSRLGLFGFDLDYLDSTRIIWIRLGLNLDYLDSTWIIWIRRFCGLVSTWIIWIRLGLNLDYLDSTWIIWIRRFCGLVSTWIIWIRLGLFGFDDFCLGLDLDYLDSTWIIWIRLGLFGFDLLCFASVIWFLLILNTWPRSVIEPSTIPCLLEILSILPPTPFPRTSPRSQQARRRIHEAPNTMFAAIAHSSVPANWSWGLHKSGGILLLCGLAFPTWNRNRSA